MNIKPDSDSQKITGKVIDLKRATEFLNKTDISYAKKMLNMLVDTFPNELKILESSYQQNNWDEIISVAHRLRGCTIYAGAYRLHLASANLENALTSKNSGNPENAEKLYQSLISEIAKVKQAYQKL